MTTTSWVEMCLRGMHTCVCNRKQAETATNEQWANGRKGLQDTGSTCFVDIVEFPDLLQFDSYTCEQLACGWKEARNELLSRQTATNFRKTKAIMCTVEQRRCNSTTAAPMNTAIVCQDTHCMMLFNSTHTLEIGATERHRTLKILNGRPWFTVW